MSDGGMKWERSVRSRIGPTVIATYSLVVLLLTSVAIWGATAPLSRAVVAPGVMAAAGRNVYIQHKDGGIVKDILVQEGDKVQFGEKLLLLESIDAASQVNRLQKQHWYLLARLARLVAERDDAPRIALFYDAEGISDRGSEVASIVAEQQREFIARRARFVSEQAILRQRKDALREAIAGLTAQKGAIDRQLAIVHEELSRKKVLVDQGLTNQFEYTQIQKSEADLVGQSGSIVSQLASLNIQTVEANEQIERLKTQRVEQAVSELSETRSKSLDIHEQLVAAEAALERTTLRSPVDGIVISSLFNSKGGVVAPGEKLFEILPTSSKLIVDARLRHQDIDSVRREQAARIRLPALNARLTPELPAVVTYVSADRILDNDGADSYYVARLSIVDGLPLRFDIGQLYPGMPVEAYIETGERTFFEYLVRPVLDSLNKSLIEE